MSKWTVELPREVRPPYEVWVNGVLQVAGRDYTARGRTLAFSRELRKDEVSKRRWLLGAWGVGTYRKDDSVDVTWRAADGRPRAAHRLDITPPRDAPHAER